MFPLLLALIALFGARKGPRKLTPDKGPRGRIPEPRAPRTQVSESGQDLVCSLLGGGVAYGAVLPQLLRMEHPAVSWPAADEWSADDLLALPPEDVATYRSVRGALDRLLASDAFLSRCTSLESPYAHGRVQRRRGKYVATWTYDGRVHGTGTTETHKTTSLDTARQAVMMGVWFFGVPADDGAEFVEASTDPVDDTKRWSIWRDAGAYGVAVVRGIGANEASTWQVYSTLEEAREAARR